MYHGLYLFPWKKEFKQKLLDNIRGGKTNLPSGGVGLEELVCALFESQGYKSKVLSKSTFNGMADADVEAIRDDDFWTTKIYAQVKHHDGTSGRYGIDQIIKAIQEMADNGDYNKGFFIM